MCRPFAPSTQNRVTETRTTTMVKENPRTLARREKRRRLMEKLKNKHNQNPFQPHQNPNNNNSPSSSSPSPPLPINPLKRRSPSPSSPPPPPLSPPPSAGHISLSSPVPTCIKRQMGVSRSFSDTKSPEFRRALPRNGGFLSQLPPLPPPMLPSPQLLRRAVSDPAPLRVPVSHPEAMKKVCKNLAQMNKVFDEIANEQGFHGSSSKLGRKNNRTRLSMKGDDRNERKMVRERAVGTERMDGDWTRIKINCPCGLDYQLLISEIEKKCYFKLA